MISADPPVQSERSAGSPHSGEPAFIVVGRLRKPHGIRGEMLMELLTEFPERLQAGLEIYVGEGHQLFHIRKCRGHQKGFIISFWEHENRDDVEELRNNLVYVHTDSIPQLSEGEYYHHQIMGLRVISDRGDFLGTVTSIIETGSNDVCVVKSESGQEILLPVIDSVILDIKAEAGEMIVHLISGLVSER
jgi:16S rRNA processing protein RimM